MLTKTDFEDRKVLERPEVTFVEVFAMRTERSTCSPKYMTIIDRLFTNGSVP